MLHAGSLALLVISSVLTMRPRDEQDPTATRDTSSLIVTKLSALGSDLEPCPHPQDD